MAPHDHQELAGCPRLCVKILYILHDRVRKIQATIGVLQHSYTPNMKVFIHHDSHVYSILFKPHESVCLVGLLFVRLRLDRILDHESKQ